MRVRRLTLENFRGIATGEVVLTQNTLLVGGNNIGKSTVCEALDLLLGPERLFRRPVVDEHDFYRSKYRDGEGSPIEIRLHAVLIDLSPEVQRTFAPHLRLWDDDGLSFIDESSDGIERSEDESVGWALSIMFRGRYDPEEDDFIGGTFFAHPTPTDSELDDEIRDSLGGGHTSFNRSHKRICGFVFLRALRTGSRALTLQRGSLLDTILRLGNGGTTELWNQSLAALENLDPAIGEVEQLASIRRDLNRRLSTFVQLANDSDPTTFHASNLTRDQLRQFVQLFLATQPSGHVVPHARQGTGSLNLIVFALLTMIADKKGNQSVIFAMEEPEIALPPHTQRRVANFVLRKMGQSIVTSHSPYVIEQFEPEDIVILTRPQSSELRSVTVANTNLKTKKYRLERRQFAEAILARAVLVCEGATEAVVARSASSAAERTLGEEKYTHFDLSGVSIFTADGDGDVPRYGPIFNSMEKVLYAFTDQPKEPWVPDAKAQLDTYKRHFESPFTSIEHLLAQQTPVNVLRRFLDEVSERSDFPKSGANYSGSASTDTDIRTIVRSVLKVRKGEGWGYAGVVLDHCETYEEIPEFLRAMMEDINADLALGPIADFSGDEEE